MKKQDMKEMVRSADGEGQVKEEERNHSDNVGPSKKVQEEGKKDDAVEQHPKNDANMMDQQPNNGYMMDQQQWVMTNGYAPYPLLMGNAQYPPPMGYVRYPPYNSQYQTPGELAEPSPQPDVEH